MREGNDVRELHPSTHFLCLLIHSWQVTYPSCQWPRGGSTPARSQAYRRATTHTDNHSHSHHDQFRLIRNRSAQRKPPHAQGEHANSTERERERERKRDSNSEPSCWEETVLTTPRCRSPLQQLRFAILEREKRRKASLIDRQQPKC